MDFCVRVYVCVCIYVYVYMHTYKTNNIYNNNQDKKHENFKIK